jgi:DNA-binding NarL/FixJ family response regulator
VDRLRQSELRGLVAFLAGLTEVRTLSKYGDYVVRELHSLVACEHISYNELPFPDEGPRFSIFPTGAAIPITRELASFRRHAHEHPVLARYAERAGDMGWVKLSDFLTKRQFHRTALYNEYYRRVGVEAQLIVVFPSSRAVDIAISINRTAGDFRERHRLTLNLVRHHLRRTYEAVETSERIERQLMLVMRGTATAQLGVAIVAEARITTVNQRARRWLRDYFEAAHSAERLPSEVEQWLAKIRWSPISAHRFVKDVGSRRLTVRAVRRDDETLLLLEETVAAPRAEAFTALGLTPRESEVLTWVTEGKTNPEIGLILGRSSRTVQHHLDAIFKKLGVETRTAAAAHALAMATALQGPESDELETAPE